MTELEKYIRANAAAFDTASPAEGHEDRFLARLGEPAAPSFWERIRRAFQAGPVPAFATALALTLLLVLVVRPGDPFRGVSDDPEAIYLAYMGHVADLYRAAPAEGGAEWDEALQAMTEEDVPLYAQIPEELPRRQQARILKRYYATLLSEARQFTNIR